MEKQWNTNHFESCRVGVLPVVLSTSICFVRKVIWQASSQPAILLPGCIKCPCQVPFNNIKRQTISITMSQIKTQYVLFVYVPSNSHQLASPICKLNCWHFDTSSAACTSDVCKLASEQMDLKWLTKGICLVTLLWCGSKLWLCSEFVRGSAPNITLFRRVCMLIKATKFLFL